jgi:DNA helicase-2/ATP-dependent DNA helicase PcrA
LVLAVFLRSRPGAPGRPIGRRSALDLVSCVWHHSDLLEVELTARRIPFVKFGGLKILEAAHVKDFLAGLRLLDNPADEIAWFRILRLLDGIGPARGRGLCSSVAH